MKACKRMLLAAFACVMLWPLSAMADAVPTPMDPLTAKRAVKLLRAVVSR